MRTQGSLIIGLLLAMWIVWIIDLIVPAELTRAGLVPRTLYGLPGIGLMPFLHANLAHLLSNTIPLAILLGLTAATRPRAWMVVIAVGIGSGALLWMFGRSAYHIGASGLVFGLIAYLITVGIRERRLASIAVALLVGLLFGATLITGIVPRVGSVISWDGHLLGALSGVLVGIGTSRTRV